MSAFLTVAEAAARLTLSVATVRYKSAVESRFNRCYAPASDDRPSSLLRILMGNGYAPADER